MKIFYAPPRGIGDLVFSLPLLHSLRAAYPAATIEVPTVNRPGQRDMLKLIEVATPCATFIPTRQDHPLAAKLNDLFRSIIKIGGDKVEWLSQKGTIEQQLYNHYFPDNGYDLVITHGLFTIPKFRHAKQVSAHDIWGKPSCHFADFLLMLAEPAGATPIVDFTLRYDRQAPVRFNDGTPLPLSDPYIVLNLGASIVEKQWNAAGFSAVAQWCAAHNYEPIVIGTGTEYALAQDITNARLLVPQRGVNLDLENFCRLSTGASAMVSGDTGLLHIADAVGTKVVGLYGPTAPSRFAPYHQRSSVVCSSNECMDSLDPHAVIAMLEQRLC